MTELYSLYLRLFSPVGVQRWLLSSLSGELVSEHQWLEQYRIVPRNTGSGARHPEGQSCSTSLGCVTGQGVSSLVLTFTDL